MASAIMLQHAYVKEVNWQTLIHPFQSKTAPEITLCYACAYIPLTVVSEAKAEEHYYEVVLTANLEGKVKEQIAYTLIFKQAGTFVCKALSEAEKPQALGVNAPTQLYPFARQGIYHQLLLSGFPAISLEPVDFAALAADEC